MNLHTPAKTYLYRATIGQWLERLDPQRFVCVHRLAAVNTANHQELHPRSHGDYTGLLKKSRELTLSRNHRATSRIGCSSRCSGSAEFHTISGNERNASRCCSGRSGAV